ncbi:DUF4280 domain-containing protein [Halanaerobacter jeridensis]|uniref:DUF4280 domain-containing protein n=1 Tax=Halanaerobacter jeridensis TaxID=706427 RepID=A0A939BR19_9FIRM|nr:DUF4280 domain-containing protein [Halanaerobacter jeridensis]MBM7555531.1 hypothetical protein [Halanaerobacter jeridensis]
MKKTKASYIQKTSKYEFRKDTEGNLIITYYNGEEKSKAVCIEGFKEGDYGLWIEKKPLYFIENGQIVSTDTGTRAGISEVLALKENKFLKEENRIKNDFLWIHDQEVIVFPHDKEQGQAKTKQQSEAVGSPAKASGASGKVASSSNKGTKEKQDKNNNQEKANDSSNGGAQLYVCSGAVLKCSCGGRTSNLQVVSGHNAKVCGNLIANIMDHQPMTNVPSFGYCKDPKNSCVPNLPSPWTKVKKDVKVGQHPALLEGSTLTCSNGGQIEIVDPGQSILKE